MDQLSFGAAVLLTAMVIFWNAEVEAFDKSNIGLATGEVFYNAPVYCTHDWTCTAYCKDKTACCVSPKMGMNVPYGTCHCCEDPGACGFQSQYGCSSCFQVETRYVFSSKSTACQKVNSNPITAFLGFSAKKTNNIDKE